MNDVHNERVYQNTLLGMIIDKSAGNAQSKLSILSEVKHVLDNKSLHIL